MALTGATGGVGSTFARAATASGHEVRALVRDPGRAKYLEEHGVELLRGELGSTGALDALCDGMDVIVHAAAQVGDGGTPEEFHRVNVEGTRAVVEAAAKGKLRRLVHVSSVAVYGRPEYGIIDESFTPLSFPGPYEATKLAAEQLAMTRGKALGLEVTAIRPPVIYGEYDRQFLPRLLRELSAGRVVLIDGGRAPFNVVSASALADALLLAADHPRAAFECFNVAAIPPPFLREVFFAVADAAGLRRPRISVPMTVAMAGARGLEAAFRVAGKRSKPPLTPFLVTVLTRHVVYDASKAKRVLGWKGTGNPLLELGALAHRAKTLDFS